MVYIFIRPQLFKRWTTLSTRKITIHWIAQLVSEKHSYRPLSRGGHLSPLFPATFKPSQDCQFVEYSRGLYVKERLLNNKIKGVNHEISKNNAAIVRVTNFKNVCVMSSTCCLFKMAGESCFSKSFTL